SNIKIIILIILSYCIVYIENSCAPPGGRETRRLKFRTLIAQADVAIRMHGSGQRPHVRRERKTGAKPSLSAAAKNDGGIPEGNGGRGWD
ncbi:MAG: hypothetical protein ACPGRZ_17710, partial [Alphaproteobacteria bacterium]